MIHLLLVPLPLLLRHLVPHDHLSINVVVRWSDSCPTLETVDMVALLLRHLQRTRHRAVAVGQRPSIGGGDDDVDDAVVENGVVAAAVNVVGEGYMI